MSTEAAMSRRQLLAAAAGAPLASVAGTAVPGSRAGQTTFVLVHGAWHGGWCWRKLVPLLRANGHEVLAPTLTGLGERSHLLAADIDLETHIDDVAATLECEDLESVTLVGHSYGGMVITGVAGRVASRVSHMIYLDAFFPDEGKALSDYAPVPPTRADGWRVPPPGTPSSWGVTNAQDIAWMERRVGDQPVRTFTQPVRQSAAAIPVSRQAFIQCTRAPFFAEAAERARRRGLRSHELFSGGHDSMITEPARLAEILVSLV